jgi:hypothetical protein
LDEATSPPLKVLKIAEPSVEDGLEHKKRVEAGE